MVLSFIFGSLFSKNFACFLRLRVKPSPPPMWVKYFACFLRLRVKPECQSLPFLVKNGRFLLKNPNFFSKFRRFRYRNWVFSAAFGGEVWNAPPNEVGPPKYLDRKFFENFPNFRKILLDETPHSQN